jgi:hypothetical protein
MTRTTPEDARVKVREREGERRGAEFRRYRWSADHDELKREILREIGRHGMDKGEMVGRVESSRRDPALYSKIISIFFTLKTVPLSVWHRICPFAVGDSSGVHSKLQVKFVGFRM